MLDPRALLAQRACASRPVASLVGVRSEPRRLLRCPRATYDSWRGYVGQPPSPPAEEAGQHPRRTGTVSESLVRGYLMGLEDMDEEHDYWVESDSIEGEIPDELAGTLYRNGPGRVNTPLGKVAQPFQADGMLVSMAFRSGQVFFRNRHISRADDAPRQMAQRALSMLSPAAGSVLSDWHLDPFAVLPSNRPNARAVCWNGRLLALDEGSLPYELHKRQLTAADHSTVDGLFAPHERVAPHTRTHIDAAGAETLVFRSVAARGVDALLTFTTLPSADTDHPGNSDSLHPESSGTNKSGIGARGSGPRARKSQFVLPGAIYGLFHDFALTQDYYVVYENPVRPNVPSLVGELAGLLTSRSVAQTFDIRPDVPCKVHLLPRPGSSRPPRVFLVPQHMQALHHVNAFQTGAGPAGGYLVLDSVTHRHVDLHATLDELDDSYFVTANRPDLMRFVIDLQSGEMRQRVLSHRACDFPAINPRYSGYGHSCIFTPAAGVEDARQWGPNQVIMKLTVSPEAGTGLDMSTGTGGCEIWSPGDMCFTQECTFVERPEARCEDDGWLLTFVFDAKRNTSRLVILDALSISRGPVCTIHLPHYLPLGMHSTWSPHYYGPAVSAPQRWSSGSHGAAQSSPQAVSQDALSESGRSAAQVGSDAPEAKDKQQNEPAGTGFDVLQPAEPVATAATAATGSQGQLSSAEAQSTDGPAGAVGHRTAHMSSYTHATLAQPIVRNDGRPVR